MAAGDRDNFNGDISVTVPTGGYTKGLIYLIADGYFVARETAIAGASCLMAATGAVWAQKDAGTGLTLAVGDKVYALNNELVGATATGAVLLNATVIRAAGADDTAALIDLHGTIPPTAT